MTTPPPAELVSLDRHQRAREEGRPTVSVLVGTAEACDEVWQSWGLQCGFHPVVAVGTDPQAVTRSWVEEHLRLPDAYGWGAQRLAHGFTALRLPEEWATAPATHHDLSHRVRQVWPQGTETGVDQLCLAILRATSQGALDPAALADALCVERGVGAFQTVCDLVPRDARGALWLRSTEGRVMEALGTAATIAHRVPSVPIGFATDTAVVSAVDALPSGDRLRALFVEGRVPVEGGRAATLTCGTPGDGALQVVRQRFQDEGAPKTLLAALDQVARVSADAAVPTNAEGEIRARSAAEAFLHQMLSWRTSTRGRYELNGDPGVRHRSGRAMEVDLVGVTDRIAIEIDGYYHFQDGAAYRRDREKDWLLHRAGWVVLRFLADDVVPRLESILSRIESAQRWRAWQRRQGASG